MAVYDGNHLWVFTAWKYGGIQRAVEAALELGFDGLIIKAHDGDPKDDPRGFHEQVLAALDLGRPRGLTIGAWGYLYGPRFGTPQIDVEAQAVIETIGLGVDWYIIDAEVQWERDGGAQSVRRLMETIRARYSDFPIGFTTFWNTRWHPKYPYRAFSEYCNVVLPQVYYVLARRETPEKIAQMWSITRTDFAPYGLPLAPIGQALGATTEQISAFADLIGATTPRSWWLWDNCPLEVLQTAASTTNMVPRQKYEEALARAEAAEEKLRRIRELVT